MIPEWCHLLPEQLGGRGRGQQCNVIIVYKSNSSPFCAVSYTVSKGIVNRKKKKTKSSYGYAIITKNCGLMVL